MRLVRAGVAHSEALGLISYETESMFTRYALNDVPALERAVESWTYSRPEICEKTD
jgi:hypothetical protein